MKTVLALIALVCLAACAKTVEEWQVSNVDLVNTPGLEDCKYIYINRGALADELRVIRCPNSNTTTSSPVSHGKSHSVQSVTVSDGQ